MMSRYSSRKNQVGGGVWGGGCVGVWGSEGSTEYDVRILRRCEPAGFKNVVKWDSKTW